MQVVVGEHSGFCFGVKRAVEIAEATGAKGTAFTLGPLVHNPQVISKLRETGVIPVSSLDEISDGCMIVPSHGLPPDIIDEARMRGLRVVHATCPYVKRIQNLVAELDSKGYQIFIVGDEGHTEVVGLVVGLSNARVVKSSEDVASGSIEPRVGVFARPPNSRGFSPVRRLALRAKELWPTIQYAMLLETTGAARELARSVDAVVVVGGRASANTRRLVEICKAEGAKVYWVEGPGDLNALDLKTRKGGLTAGHQRRIGLSRRSLRG